MNNIKINGCSYQLPRSPDYFLEPEVISTEEWLLKLLIRINAHHSIMQFIDVGVNLGQTLLKIKSVNPNSRYLGFEPNPNCFEFVTKLIGINNIEEVLIHEKGLSNQEGIVELEFSNNDLFDSSASSVPGFRSKIHRKIEIKVAKLDVLIKNFGIDEIDVIKVDIEGGELEAIEGMRQTLLKYNPIIIIEVLPDYNGKNQTRTQRQSQLTKILTGLGYSLYHISDKTNMSFRPIDSFPSHSNVELSDYLAFPSNKRLQDYGLTIDSGIPTATSPQPHEAQGSAS